MILLREYPKKRRQRMGVNYGVVVVICTITAAVLFAIAFR